MKDVLKKITALTIVLIMACSVIAGCTHGENNDPGDVIIIGSDTPVPSTTEPPADTAVPTESETPADDTDVPATETYETDIPDTDVPTDVPTQAPTDTPTQAATPTPTNPPTPKPTADPNVTQVPQGSSISIGTKAMPARFTMPTDLYGLSESQCEQFFSDAVFVGDSLTLGWKNYNNKMLENNSNFFGKTRFLCEGSYGVGHAFDPISDSSLHPIYGGEQHYLWDSIAMMGAKKVFILFGLNDLSIYGVDGTAELFDQLLENIKAKSPGVQIFIISAMYMYKGSERPKLNNPNLYLLNQALVDLCNKRGYEFLNIASHLIDENGYVPEQYSSDHYVHQTYAAYDIWAQILRSVAARHIKGMDPVVFHNP